MARFHDGDGDAQEHDRHHQASVRNGIVNQVHTNMVRAASVAAAAAATVGADTLLLCRKQYDAGGNPDVRDALAAFLIATGPLSHGP